MGHLKDHIIDISKKVMNMDTDLIKCTALVVFYIVGGLLSLGSFVVTLLR